MLKLRSYAKLGDRVWIGANVTILKGVTIGNDAVVGAGSVVTQRYTRKGDRSWSSS